MAIMDITLTQHPLPVALKEWAIVCELLTLGKCALLLRKGGVHEDEGPGRFRLEHERFALFPAAEHERLDWIKPAFRIRDEPLPARPEHVDLPGIAEVAKIWEVPSRAAFDRLDDLHPWDTPQIDMRFHYKPERPLYLVAVKAYRLPEPHRVPYTDAYLGCRSWVDLDAGDAVPTGEAEPAMTAEALQRIVDRVDDAFAL